MASGRILTIAESAAASVKNLFVVGKPHSGLKSWDTVKHARREFVFGTTPNGGATMMGSINKKGYGVYDIAAIVHGIASYYPSVFAKENVEHSTSSGCRVQGGPLLLANFRVRLQTIWHIQQTPTRTGGLGTLYDYFNFQMKKRHQDMDLNEGDVVKLCKCCGTFTKVANEKTLPILIKTLNIDIDSKHVPGEGFFKYRCANCMATNREAVSAVFGIVVESIPCHTVQGPTTIQNLLTCLYTDMPPPAEVPAASQYHNAFHNKRLMHALNKADRVLVNSLYGCDHQSTTVSLLVEQRLLDIPQMASETDLLSVVGRFINLHNFNCNVECPSPIVVSAFSDIVGTRLMSPYNTISGGHYRKFKPGPTLRMASKGVHLVAGDYYLYAKRMAFNNGLDSDKCVVRDGVLYTPMTNSSMMMEWDAPISDALSISAGVTVDAHEGAMKVVDIVNGTFYSIVKLEVANGMMVRQLENKSTLVVKLPQINTDCLTNNLGLFGLKWSYQLVNVELLNRLLIFILSSSPSHNALSTYVASLSNTRYMMGDRKVDLSNIWLTESMPELVMACLLINDCHRSTTVLHSLLGPKTSIRSVSNNLLEFLLSRFVRGALSASGSTVSDMLMATQLWFKRGENTGKFSLSFDWANLMQYRHTEVVTVLQQVVVEDTACGCKHDVLASALPVTNHRCMCCQRLVSEQPLSLCSACAVVVELKPKCHHVCKYNHSKVQNHGETVACPCCGLQVDVVEGCECCPHMVVQLIKNVHSNQAKRLEAVTKATTTVASNNRENVLQSMMRQDTTQQPLVAVETETRSHTKALVKTQQQPNDWFKLSEPSQLMTYLGNDEVLTTKWMCNKMVLQLRHSGVNSDMLLGHNHVEVNCALEILHKLSFRTKEDFINLYSETGLHSVADILDICESEEINCVIIDSDSTLKIVRGGKFDGAYVVLVHGSVVTGYTGVVSHWMESVMPTLLSWPTVVLDCLDYDRVGIRAQSIDDSRDPINYNALVFKQRQLFEKTQRELQNTTVTELGVTSVSGAVVLKNSSKNDLVRGMVNVKLPEELFTFALACLSSSPSTEVLAYLSDVPHLIYPTDAVCRYMRPVEIQSAYKINCVSNIKFQLALYHKQMASLINFAQEDVKIIETFDDPVTGFFSLDNYPSIKVLDQVAVRTSTCNKIVTVQYVDGRKCLNLTGLQVSALIIFKFSVASTLRSLCAATTALTNFDLLSKIKMGDVVVGPGGSGKSTRIAALPNKQTITIVAKTRDAMLKYKDKGYAAVNTVESMIIQGGCQTPHLIIDEATLVSEYEFPALLSSKCTTVSLYGDLNQIGVVDFGGVVGVRSTRNVLQHFDAVELKHTYRYGLPLLNYVNQLLGENYTNPNTDKTTGFELLKVDGFQGALDAISKLDVDAVYVFYNNHYAQLSAALKTTRVSVRKLHAHQGSEASRVAILHLTSGVRGGITSDKAYVTTALTRAVDHLYWITDLEGDMSDIIAMVQPLGGHNPRSALLNQTTGTLLRLPSADEVVVVQEMLAIELGANITIVKTNPSLPSEMAYTVTGERDGMGLSYDITSEGVIAKNMLSSALKSQVVRALLKLAGKINDTVINMGETEQETAPVFFDCEMTSNALYAQNVNLSASQLSALYCLILVQRQCKVLGQPLTLPLDGENYIFTPFDGCSVTAGVKFTRVGGFGDVVLAGLHVPGGDSVLRYLAGCTRTISGIKCEVDVLSKTIVTTLESLGKKLGSSWCYSLWWERIKRVSTAKISCSNVDKDEYLSHNRRLTSASCDYGHEKFLCALKINEDGVVVNDQNQHMKNLIDVVLRLAGVQGVNDNFTLDGESIRRFGALYGTRKAVALSGSLMLSVPQDVERVIDSHFKDWLNNNNVQFVAKHSADNECRLLVETVVVMHLSRYFPDVTVHGDVLRDSILYFNPILSDVLRTNEGVGDALSVGWSGEEDMVIKCAVVGGATVLVGTRILTVGANPVEVQLVEETDNILFKFGSFVVVCNKTFGKQRVLYRHEELPSSKLLFNIPQYSNVPVVVDRKLYKAVYSRALIPGTSLNDLLQYCKSFVSSQIYSKSGVESVREQHLQKIHITAFIAHNLATKANVFTQSLSSNHFSTGKDNLVDNLQQLVKSVGMSMLASLLSNTDLSAGVEKVVERLLPATDGVGNEVVNFLADARVELLKLEDVVHVYNEVAEDISASPTDAGRANKKFARGVVSSSAATEERKAEKALLLADQLASTDVFETKSTAVSGKQQVAENWVFNDSHADQSDGSQPVHTQKHVASVSLLESVMLEDRSAKYGWKLAKKTFKPEIQKKFFTKKEVKVKPTLVCVYAGSRGDSTPLDAIIEQLCQHMDVTVVAPKDAVTVFPTVSYHYYCDSYQPLTDAAVRGDSGAMNRIIVEIGSKLLTLSNMLGEFDFSVSHFFSREGTLFQGKTNTFVLVPQLVEGAGFKTLAGWSQGQVFLHNVVGFLKGAGSVRFIHAAATSLYGVDAESIGFPIGKIELEYDDVTKRVSHFITNTIRKKVTLVTLGSMHPTDLKNKLSAMLERVTGPVLLVVKAEKNSVITFRGRPIDISEESYSVDIIVVRSVKHKLIMSLCSHAHIHGGAGTMQTCQLLGVPTTIHPVAFDQQYNKDKFEQCVFHCDLPELVNNFRQSLAKLFGNTYEPEFVYDIPVSMLKRRVKDVDVVVSMSNTRSKTRLFTATLLSYKTLPVQVEVDCVWVSIQRSLSPRPTQEKLNHLKRMWDSYNVKVNITDAAKVLGLLLYMGVSGLVADVTTNQTHRLELAESEFDVNIILTSATHCDVLERCETSTLLLVPAESADITDCVPKDDYYSRVVIGEDILQLMGEANEGHLLTAVPGITDRLMVDSGIQMSESLKTHIRKSNPFVFYPLLVSSNCCVVDSIMVSSNCCYKCISDHGLLDVITLFDYSLSKTVVVVPISRPVVISFWVKIRRLATGWPTTFTPNQSGNRAVACINQSTLAWCKEQNIAVAGVASDPVDVLYVYNTLNMHHHLEKEREIIKKSGEIRVVPKDISSEQKNYLQSESQPRMVVYKGTPYLCVEASDEWSLMVLAALNLCEWVDVSTVYMKVELISELWFIKQFFYERRSNDLHKPVKFECRYKCKVVDESVMDVNEALVFFNDRSSWVKKNLRTIANNGEFNLLVRNNLPKLLSTYSSTLNSGVYLGDNSMFLVDGFLLVTRVVTGAGVGVVTLHQEDNEVEFRRFESKYIPGQLIEHKRPVVPSVGPTDSEVVHVLHSLLGPQVNDVGPKDFEIINAEPLAIVPCDTPIGSVRFDSLPSPVSVEYRHNSEVRDNLVWLPTCLGFKVNARLAATKIKQIKTRLLEPYPEFARSSVTKELFSEFNSVTKRQGALTNLAVTPLVLRDEFKLFKELYLNPAKLSQIGTWDPVSIDVVASKEWLLKHNYPKDVLDSLKKLLVQTFELNTINAIAVHAKVEQTTKISAMARWVEEVSARSILASSYAIAAIFSPVFLNLKKRLQYCLVDEVVYVDGMSSPQLATYLQQLRRPNWYVEDDLTAQDRQTNLDVIELEKMVYLELGCEPGLVEFYLQCHRHWSWKGFGIRGVWDAMRLTGQVTTALGNAVTNLLVHMRFFHRNRQSTICYLLLGDDCLFLMDNQADVKKHGTEVAQLYNMESKVQQRQNVGGFLSMIIADVDGTLNVYPHLKRLRHRLSICNYTFTELDLMDKINQRKISYCNMLCGFEVFNKLNREKFSVKPVKAWYRGTSAVLANALFDESTEGTVLLHLDAMRNMLESDEVITDVVSVFSK